MNNEVESLNQRRIQWRLNRLEKNQISGRRFRLFLYDHFVNQTDCANMLGVSRSAISHYCTGDSKIPKKILEALEIIFPGKMKEYDLD